MDVPQIHAALASCRFDDMPKPSDKVITKLAATSGRLTLHFDLELIALYKLVAVGKDMISEASLQRAKASQLEPDRV